MYSNFSIFSNEMICAKHIVVKIKENKEKENVFNVLNLFNLFKLNEMSTAVLNSDLAGQSCFPNIIKSPTIVLLFVKKRKKRKGIKKEKEEKKNLEQKSHALKC